MTGPQSPAADSRVADSPVVAEIRRLRALDALGRITVIVASFGAARDLVRALALSGGAAGVAVRTADQVVADLSAPALAPRAALPFPLLEAAVEKALDADPGELRAVAGEPVTGQAVARACLRLGTVEAGSVAAENRLHSEVLRLSEQARAMTGSAYYTQFEAVSGAIERLDGLGRVVLAAPLRGTEAERRLRAALHSRGVTPIPGTGADHLASAAEPDGDGAVTGTHVLHASDPDDEVRAVVRFVRSRLADGLPGHRIGVYYPSPDPYLRLLIRAFSEAEIVVNGPSATDLGRTTAGRSLVRLLAIDPDLMPRADLLSIVAEGAVALLDDRGTAVSSRRLEMLTRMRVPVIGAGDWTRLADHLADRGDQSGDGFTDSDRAAAAALLHLVDRIRSTLGALESARTWSEVGETLDTLLTSLFRQTPDRAAVQAAVGSLADLDTLSPAITRERIVGAVSTRLDSITERVGEEGAGVSLGPIDDAVGRDLDTVCVVGMAEGLLPVLHRPDPLLPEGAVEPPASELLDERYRVLQLALSAGANRRLCSFPRGSMRGGGHRIPSRWLLPTLSRLSGEQVHATRWQEAVAGCPAVTAVPSFVDGVLSPAPLLGPDPATPTELRLRELAARGWRAGPTAPEPLIRAHEMRRDRRLGVFSRFTGDVSSVNELVTVLDTPVSPTRLEDWAQSPYLFFLATVLRVRVLDDPAADIEMDLRDYGDLVHAILQRYVGERLALGVGPDRDLLMRALSDECDKAVAAAPGLLTPLWRRRRMLLAAELGRWFEEDSADSDAGWRPTATELGFGRGLPGEPSAGIALEVITSRGPETLLLAGSIDRLDVRDGAQRVTDYKTGKPPGVELRPGEDDPTVAGTRFQLPLYAAAAASARHMPVSEARYWYCTERGGFEQISLTISDAVMDRVRSDVGHLVDAIRRGWFPLKGGRGSSRDLADLLGGADLDRTWERLSRREPLASHPAFVGIVAGDTAGTGTESTP
ncbi:MULTISPECIES: PD-(D/E)XK nuclease family protein [unclassified Dietzia]|uniref:PD-(D/E)XK nuclease family protein n=2 Tax=Dietzia TaxID=37914 RepID=UPI000D217C18|nr:MULTISPECIES: PD-(D/E)XK nuclease family protein [unclassified Dietzia]AVZ40958.1 PD-(D/E)XK nuclease family protein [Dietzia sp. JS16-p6b]QGW23163.1 ATP-dependent nuclease subunit B-like protein [Dietzia sp. DQ12-45-1b]